MISKRQLESTQKQKSLIYSDFILNGYGWLWLFTSRYLPMQNFEKILFRTSSGAMAPRPVISPKCRITGRNSSLNKSAGSPSSRLSMARCKDSRAAVRAS